MLTRPSPFTWIQGLAGFLAEGGRRTMKKAKTFDCVQMKWGIQRKLMEEEKGLSWHERNRHAREKGLADPILGPWFQKAMGRQSTQTAVACVAEARAKYGKRDKRRGHSSHGYG
jgi:hypothetical protein